MTRRLSLLLPSLAILLMFGLWLPFKAVVAQEVMAMAWAESQARPLEPGLWPRNTSLAYTCAP